jgi:predicted dinucleotide-binding enzyme
MKIGVLGSGIVGQVLASGFLKHGHEAMLSSRDPQKAEVREWLGKNPKGKTGTFTEAARWCDLAVLSTLGRVVESALEMAGTDNLAGKTLIDTTNPLAETPPVQGILAYTTGPNESLGEQIQAKFPRTLVVKAFNSVGNNLMINPHFEQGMPTMFYCGNDTNAKEQVAKIIKQFGWEPYDCGGIIASRALEPLCMLWCLPGFQRNEWNHAFKVVTH